MTELEKIDFTLLTLYKSTVNGGMVSVISSFQANRQVLEIDELAIIKNLLEDNGYAVFQVEKLDYRGQITDDGKIFVETNSFSVPGTSILTLEE
jgi:hypothetical protein